MSKNGQEYIFFMILAFFELHASQLPPDRSKKIFQKLQTNHEGHIIRPLGCCTVSRYRHVDNPTISISLCQNCSYNCLMTVGYSGSQIDQLVCFTASSRFINALAKDTPIEHNNGILMFLSIMDSYSLNSSVSHARKLCNGDYTSGAKPFHWIAARHSHTQAAQVLLDYGADVNIMDHEGKTSLDHAIAANNLAMIPFVLHNGGRWSQSSSIRSLIRTGHLKPVILPNPKIN